MTGTRAITVRWGRRLELKSVVRDGKTSPINQFHFGESDVAVEVTLTSNFATVTVP